MNDFLHQYLNKHVYIITSIHSLTNDSYICTNLFLFPVSSNEIISTFSSLSNSQSVGNEELHPNIIKSIASLISSYLKNIINLSFSQGIFQSYLRLQLSFLYTKQEHIMTQITTDPY